MKNDKLFLSVVIPAYNEAHDVGEGSLQLVYDYLSKQKYKWEVLVVDDGSTDETAKLVQNFAKNHPGFILKREPHRGKGGTVIAGILMAEGEYVVFTDMDQSTPLDQIEKFFPKFNQGYDVVIGSRSGREGAPVIRKIMAFGFVVLRSLVLRLPFKDTQCGFKAFKKDAAEKVFGKLKKVFDQRNVKGNSVSAGFDVEMLYLARKMGYKIAEVPVIWYYKEGTKINPIKESWVGFKGVISVRIKSILGRYNL